MNNETSLLMVDDDPASLRVLSRILAHYPDQRLATSGEQALALARARAPDLMLIDMDMPGMSGTQLCALVKNDPSLAHVPVLFVTSDDTETTQLEALALGAADFVTKPIRQDQLRARVATVLRSATEVERAKHETAATPSPDRTSLHAGPARLLLASGAGPVALDLQHTLEGLGQVRTAALQHDTLTVVTAWAPDMVLMLVHTEPEAVTGLALCQQLKALPDQRHVPVVFVSTADGDFDGTRALAIGAADLISTPFSPAVVRARVRNLLELKRRTDIELAMVAAQGQRLEADRLAAVVEGVSDAIITLHADGTLAVMNAAAGRLMQRDPSAMAGTAAQGWLSERLPDLDLFTPTSARRVMVRHGNAPPTPAEVSVSTIGEGARRLTTLVFRDLTDRERLQEESSARAAAEASNRAKALMMSYVAHEIGNPLNCIMGFAQLLGSDGTEPLTAAQARRLAMIETGCAQLMALMQDLSALGQHELGHLTISVRPVDARATAQEAMQTLSGLAQQAGIHLSLDAAMAPDAPVMADANRLRQCLTNLISNGIKYNRAGGRVTVLLRSEPGTMEIEVSDTGIGMTEAQRAQLFEPFNRLGRQTGEQAGTGLGLVVTRQLIEAMGGRMSVWSQPNEGSRFMLQLTLADDDADD